MFSLFNFSCGTLFRQIAGNKSMHQIFPFSFNYTMAPGMTHDISPSLEPDVFPQMLSTATWMHFSWAFSSILSNIFIRSIVVLINQSAISKDWLDLGVMRQIV